MIHEYDYNGMFRFESIPTNNERSVPVVVRKRRERNKLTKDDIPFGLMLFFHLLRCSLMRGRWLKSWMFKGLSLCFAVTQWTQCPSGTSFSNIFLTYHSSFVPCALHYHPASNICEVHQGPSVPVSKWDRRERGQWARICGFSFPTNINHPASNICEANICEVHKWGWKKEGPGFPPSREWQTLRFLFPN